MKKPVLLTLVSIFLVLGTKGRSFAGSAAWDPNPTSGNWNTATNWTPQTVPNGSSDIATFVSSSTTAVSVSSSITVDRIVFGSGASAYTVTVPSPWILFLSGLGVVNDSGMEQNFVAPQFGTIRFNLNAVA